MGREAGAAALREISKVCGEEILSPGSGEEGRVGGGDARRIFKEKSARLCDRLGCQSRSLQSLNWEGWESGGTMNYKRKLGEGVYLGAGERGGSFYTEFETRTRDLSVQSRGAVAGTALELNGGAQDMRGKGGEPVWEGRSEASKKSVKFRERAKFLRERERCQTQKHFSGEGLGRRRLSKVKRGEGTRMWGETHNREVLEQEKDGGEVGHRQEREVRRKEERGWYPRTLPTCSEKRKTGGKAGGREGGACGLQCEVMNKVLGTQPRKL